MSATLALRIQVTGVLRAIAPAQQIPLGLGIIGLVNFEVSLIQLLSLAIGIIGLTYASYNQLSPKALVDKMNAIEDLASRMPQGVLATEEQEKKRTKQINALSTEYASLYLRAQWSISAGWSKRARMISLYTSSLVAISIGASFALEAGVDRLWESLGLLFGVVVAALVVTGIFFLRMRYLEKKHGFQGIDLHTAKTMLFPRSDIQGINAIPEAEDDNIAKRA